MPLPELHTPRLVLRPWTHEDLDGLHALWTAPEVRRYLWDDIVISRETAAEVLETHFAFESLGIGCWKVDTGSGTTGFCGFRLIGDGPDIELLYALKGELQGKGLATEACAAALDHLWRNTTYQKVYARTDPPNQRSLGVMRRLGMHHESTTASTITWVLERPAGSLT